MRNSLLLLFFAACTPVVYDPNAQQANYAKAKANADAQVDSVMARRIDRARASAKSGGSKEAWTFAKEVENAYGDKPKFGSGTTSSISSNSIQSHSFRAGDQMWIVDEHDNGISNTSVSSGMREIEISASCSGLVAR